MKRLIIKNIRSLKQAEVVKLLHDAWFNPHDKITHKIKRRGEVEFIQDTPYICAYCGKRGDDVVIHHILGRRYKSLKDYVYNWIPLCAEHHTNSSEFSAHLTPAKFRAWFEGKYPERYKKLIAEKESQNKKKEVLM